MGEAGRPRAVTVLSSSPVAAVRSPATALLLAMLMALTSYAGLAALAPRADAATWAPHNVANETALLKKVNASRAAAGRPALRVRSDLVTVARRQAVRMASQNRLYHNPYLAREVPNYRWVGENVGYAPDIPTVHVAFMRSPGHRANVLDRDYTEIGVGSVTVKGRVWVVEVFRQPVRASYSTSAGSGTASACTLRGTLRLGAAGCPVRVVQRELGMRQSGYFGAVTRGKVVTFQRAHGLPATGAVDYRTWRALLSS